MGAHYLSCGLSVRNVENAQTFSQSIFDLDEMIAAAAQPPTTDYLDNSQKLELTAAHPILPATGNNEANRALVWCSYGNTTQTWTKPNVRPSATYSLQHVT